MSQDQRLRALVTQRLTAAAEEIFGLFERTIAEYEEELCRSKEENERQRELLNAVYKPQLRLHRADMQPLSVSESGDLLEPQDWSPSLDQEDPLETPDIKQELWSGQEEEQLQELKGGKFTFTPVPVKSEEDEDEKRHSSQRHRTERMNADADGEECGGRGLAGNWDPLRYFQPDADDVPVDTRATGSVWNSMGNNGAPLSDEGSSASDKPSGCSEYGKRCSRTVKQKPHTRVQSDEKRFSCSLCSKRYTRKTTLTNHMKIHTGEKSNHCSFCNKRFALHKYLKSHMRTHTGEKPYSCSLCNKRFSQHTHLQLHKRTHTGEKPYGCAVCDRRFTWPTQRKRHKCAGDVGKFWASQEEDADVTALARWPAGKEGGDEEKPETSQMSTGGGREACGGSEPTRRLQSDTEGKSEESSETDDSDWNEQRGLDASESPVF